MKNKRLLNYTDLTIGMTLQDEQDNIGIVKEINDIHNILVEYDDGGSGLYCLEQACIEYDPLYYYKDRKLKRK